MEKQKTWKHRCRSKSPPKLPVSLGKLPRKGQSSKTKCLGNNNPTAANITMQIYGSKNQDNVKLNERKTTNANTKITKMLKLNDEDFKADLTKMLQQASTNMLKTNEK